MSLVVIEMSNDEKLYQLRTIGVLSEELKKDLMLLFMSS